MKIAVVCDQPTMTECLRGAVTQSPEHAVIWTAVDGTNAVERCRADLPDLVLVVVRTSGVNGADVTRRIMTAIPCAILLVTVDEVVSHGRVFEAMGHGAMDAIELPSLSTSTPNDSTPLLLRKISMIGRHVRLKNSAAKGVMSTTPASNSSRCSCLVAIGASAGGPAALALILAGLPKDFPAAIVIVQHVDEQFTLGMTEWLSTQSGLPVRVARDGDRLVAGAVLMAGTSDHLVLKGTDSLTYTRDPVNHVYRPSVDVFFESVSRRWRGEAVGVLLTGMGKDGAAGLRELRDRGHHTIAQDEASSAVYGMPKAAAAIDAAIDILPVRQIASQLIDLLASKRQRNANIAAARASVAKARGSR
jgi:two-component system response regulator WspF